MTMGIFKKLLCIIDPDQNYQPVVARALVLAENNQANLKIVATVARSGAQANLSQHGAAQLQTEWVNICLMKLEASLAPYRKTTEIQSGLLVGIPFLEIIREVLRNNHDLVIKAPENPSWLHSVLGSEDMHLLRKCPCAVWMLKPDSAGRHDRILAAVDVSESYPAEEMPARRALNLRVLRTAMSLALSEFAELHLVTVWDAEALGSLRRARTGISQAPTLASIEHVREKNERALKALMQEAVNSLGRETLDYLKPVSHLVIKGSPRREIPIIAKEIQTDVIVMGTVARTGISGFFMGNTAETILNQIDCSVLAVKPPGFVSPVALGG